jgi:UDP-N-acetylmuramyl tripeptide synthase
VLEVQLTPAESAEAIGLWSAAARRMIEALDWPAGQIAARGWPGGAELGLTAPTDQLLTATDVNEWAWTQAALALGRDLGPPGLRPGTTPNGFDDALPHLRAMARAEARPPFAALEREARSRQAPFRWDEQTVWIGSGRHAMAWPRDALPSPEAVSWAERSVVPTALVTGSNGKTTTTRLLAAMLRAHGLHTGHCCTDGVFVDGETLALGDYAGPLGALTTLAHPRVEAAVLETARGGILRRGLVATGADVAIVTNVQLDHFGEYGIDSHAATAAVKLTVAKAVRDGGWLVLNGGDRHLVAGEPSVRPTVHRAWFAVDPTDLVARSGQRTATLEDDRLVVRDGTTRQPLARVDEMPLSAGGVARYNIENAMAAGLAAWCLGIPATTIHRVITTFGTDAADNPGRLETWRLATVTVLTDYAHNPEGISGLLTVARSLAPKRLLLLLGQAGNRTDDAIRALAAAAWAFRPDHVVLKDLESFLRGRAPGEVPGILADELRRLGLPDERMECVLPEVDAVRTVLARTRDGDVLVLPVHGAAARAEVAALLRQLANDGWRAGMLLPERAPLPPANT